jgi:hypothetical protein
VCVCARARVCCAASTELSRPHQASCWHAKQQACVREPVLKTPCTRARQESRTQHVQLCVCMCVCMCVCRAASRSGARTRPPAGTQSSTHVSEHPSRKPPAHARGRRAENSPLSTCSKLCVCVCVVLSRDLEPAPGLLLARKAARMCQSIRSESFLHTREAGEQKTAHTAHAASCVCVCVTCCIELWRLLQASCWHTKQQSCVRAPVPKASCTRAKQRRAEYRAHTARAACCVCVLGGLLKLAELCALSATFPYFSCP